MFEPTRIGRYGENSLKFVTPDDDNRFAELLRRLDISEGEVEIVADTGDDFSPAPVHAHVARFTRPAEVEDESAPEAFVAIQVYVDDVDDREDHQPEQMLDFTAVLTEIAKLFPEHMRCHHSGRLRISKDAAHAAIDLPISIWTPPFLGRMLGARFELKLPDSELGHIILDTGDETISASLHFDRDQSCTLGNIQEGWAIIRGVYDEILLGEEAKG